MKTLSSRVSNLTSNTGTHIRNPRQDKIFEILKMGLFVGGSILFLAIYLPISITNCNNIMNNVDRYVYNASCFCKNNPGSSPAVGEFILTDNDWFRQFNYSNDVTLLFGPSPTYRSIYNGNLVVISFTTYSSYFQYYYPIEWSNTVIHNKTLTMFETYDPNKYLSSNLAPFCSIVVVNVANVSDAFVLNLHTVNDCIATTKQYLGEGFNPYINMGYSNNPTYQKACDLDYCQVPFCPQSNLITIIFFCFTVIGTYYTGLRTCKHLFVWIWYRKYRVTTAVTVPLFTSSDSPLAMSAKDSVAIGAV
jgi:hypothetical protein